MGLSTYIVPDLHRLLAHMYMKNTAIISFRGKKRINKTLGRALDPRANGTWLSKLTE